MLEDLKKHASGLGDQLTYEEVDAAFARAVERGTDVSALSSSRSRHAPSVSAELGCTDTGRPLSQRQIPQVQQQVVGSGERLVEVHSATSHDLSYDIGVFYEKRTYGTEQVLSTYRDRVGPTSG